MKVFTQSSGSIIETHSLLFNCDSSVRLQNPLIISFSPPLPFAPPVGKVHTEKSNLLWSLGGGRLDCQGRFQLVFEPLFQPPLQSIPRCSLLYSVLGGRHSSTVVQWSSGVSAPQTGRFSMLLQALTTAAAQVCSESCLSATRSS